MLQTILQDYQIIWWVLGFVCVFYLGTPLLVLFSQKLTAQPELKPLEMHTLEPVLAAFLMDRTNDLYALGYDEPVLLSMPNGAPGVKAYLITLVNRPAGDKAMVTAMVGEAAGTKMQTSYVEFSTRYDDDSVADTLNSSEIGAFAPGEKTIRTQTPSITDLGELYRLHQFVMKKHYAGKRKVLPEPGRMVEYLHEKAFRHSYEEQVSRGILKLEAGGQHYWPTVRGAYQMTWALLPPMKWYWMAKMKRQEQAILAELGAEQAKQSAS
jgi:hypothetical protein